jgi:hypothetical protein
MEKEKLTINEIDKVIADITHNLECLDEAERLEEDKRIYMSEINRFQRLYKKYEKMRMEVQYD